MIVVVHVLLVTHTRGIEIFVCEGPMCTRRLLLPLGLGELGRGEKRSISSTVEIVLRGGLPGFTHLDVALVFPRSPSLGMWSCSRRWFSPARARRQGDVKVTASENRTFFTSTLPSSVPSRYRSLLNSSCVNASPFCERVRDEFALEAKRRLRTSSMSVRKRS